MLSDTIIRSTAAFGGTPFRLNKCTALVGGALGVAGSLLGGLFGIITINTLIGKRCF